MDSAGTRQAIRGSRRAGRWMVSATAGALAAIGPFGARALAAQPPQHVLGHPTPTQWVVPQVRSFAPEGLQAVALRRVAARIEVTGQVARTQLDVHLFNGSARPAEVSLLIPVPREAAVSQLVFSGPGFAPAIEILRADEARRLYESIVRQLRDPALLEFVGSASLRSSVFPVAPGSELCVRIAYEEVLAGESGALEYLLPRSEALSASIPWSIEVHLTSDSPIAALQSTSHELLVSRDAARGLCATVSSQSLREPGPFRLSILRRRADWSASMQLYSDPEGAGGHFLLLASLPEGGPEEQGVARELSIVIDRSGSMAGGKLDQVLKAALQMVEGLAPTEAFNLIDYSSQVACFSTRPVARTQESVLAARRYLASLRPSGGTNLAGALELALAQAPAADGRARLPIVIFLTDGIPTIGETAEAKISQLVRAQGTRAKRVFTLGVGADVNAPLLDAIAETSGARATYVMPGQDVELEIARLFDKLAGPLFTDIELSVLGPDGQPDTRIWRELYPARIADLYRGEALSLLGRYTEVRGVKLCVRGRFLGQPREFTYDFDLSRSSPRNAFVPRLWAARKIATLVDALRQAGAGGLSAGEVLADPRYAELAEEIVRLSTRYGVLSEYTAFLAREGTQLDDWQPLLAGAERNFREQALARRSGEEAVYLSQNLWAGKQVARPNYKNSQLDSSGQRFEVGGVQQLADGAFLLRGSRWIESSLVGDDALGRDASELRRVQLGTPEHAALLDELARQGRQSWLSLPGETLLRVKGEPVLVQNNLGAR